MLASRLFRRTVATAQQPMLKKTFAALVVDEPGVLSRISGFFSARGFNIDSLVVGTTNMDGLSRMTIVSSGTFSKLDQLRRQMEAMVQVREVVELTPDKSALTDLLLVKLATKVVGTRARIVELSNLFRAEVLDVSADELLIKVADSPTKVDSFLKLMDKFEIVEMSRTGVVGLSLCGQPSGQISKPDVLPTVHKAGKVLSDAELPPS